MRKMPVIKSLNMETYGEEIRYGEQMDEKVKSTAEKISFATDLGYSGSYNIITDTLDLFNSGSIDTAQAGERLRKLLHAALIKNEIAKKCDACGNKATKTLDASNCDNCADWFIGEYCEDCFKKQLEAFEGTR